MRVGIEVGGTFTDLVAAGGGQVHVVKVPSAPRSLGGGGGYGDESARFAAMLARNVADGIVSPAMAAGWVA